jgi:hypothetical protein
MRQRILHSSTAGGPIGLDITLWSRTVRLSSMTGGNDR